MKPMYKIKELSPFSRKRAFEDWKEYMQDITFVYVPLDEQTFVEHCEMMDVEFDSYGNIPA